MEYLDFLKSKIEIASESGFEIETSEINPALKNHIGDIVICLDAVEEYNGRQAGKVKNRCEVTGVYPSVFTVKRPFWTESFTYIDMIRQNGVMMEWLQSEVEE